jgi:hypothetical protein
VNKVDWEPLGWCAYPKSAWHSGLCGMAHYCDAEARYRNIMCVRMFPKSCTSKTLQNGSVDSLIRILVLEKEFTMLQTHHNLFLIGLPNFPLQR